MYLSSITWLDDGGITICPKNSINSLFLSN
jgi:hypothetical protein